MAVTLAGGSAGGLERSCGRRCESIRFGSGAAGLERAEVFLSARAFAPHRHDAYAIGVTMSGVQTFRYRGGQHACLPGQVHVLHPDEPHDGAPGTARGFGYRIAYIAPELIREALGDRDLPFVPDPVHPAGPSARRVAALLADIDEPLDDLARAVMAATFCDALSDLAGLPARDRTGTDLRVVRLVRAYLAAHPREQILASELEQIAGTDRYTIARHFRRAFGTSPDRYRTMRRLALARTAIENGTPLAQAAADAGFSDQSHMTRQFTKAYGMTPARWAAAVRAGGVGGARPSGPDEVGVPPAVRSGSPAADGPVAQPCPSASQYR
jgi:AraC-like DNA-binding protein